VRERDILVLDYLVYLEPVEIIQIRSNVMKFRCFGEKTSRRDQDKLKTIGLRSRQIE